MQVSSVVALSDSTVARKAGRKRYVVDYVVKRTVQPLATKIFSDDEEIGTLVLQSLVDSAYVLKAKNNGQWTLDAKNSGEVHPFSLTVRRAGTGMIVLRILNQLFQHKGKFYMFANIPSGRPMREFLLGKRYICRLENFPFSDLNEVDSETLGRLRRFFRGVAVGEFGGLGAMSGYHVQLLRELSDIALPLSAASYILYSTA